MKKILLFIFTCAISFHSFAQSIADINSPKIMPPSPDAAALGKYGQIPVDKSTGIPSISIPLYEIKTPRFTLPISLSYHASGIRVDELASWVGTGWSLNAGGVITRSMVGVADDVPGAGYMSNPSSLPNANALFNNFHADSAYMEAVSQNQSDSQPDNFFYNFAGQSGAFIYQFINSVLTPVTIPFKPIQIKFSSNAFTVIDESGNSYWFNNREMSYSSVSNEMTGASSWYLTQMISADKSDTLKFIYTAPVTFVDNAYSFSQNLGPYSGAGGLWPLVKTTNQINGQQIYIKQILFKGGKVDFIGKTGRKDNGALALDSVIISNYDNNAQKYNRLKSFKMLTDYFHSGVANQTGFSSDSMSTYRLKLNGMTENDQNNTSVKTHQFDYNSTALPPVHNFGQDYWGYYNGYYGNQTLLEAQTISTHYSYASNYGSTYSSSVINYSIGGTQGANRSVCASCMQAGILQKITYPTKGYTLFAYEPNRFLSSVNNSNTVTVQSFAIGVYNPNSTIYFTPTQAILNSISQDGTVYFHIHLKSTGAGGYSNMNSFVELMQGSNTLIGPVYATTSQDIDADIRVVLTAGVQYQLIAAAAGGTSQTDPTTLPQASISTSYQNNSNAILPANAGGLRVTAITNYDSNNTMLSNDTYRYGPNQSGIGDLMTNSNFLINYSNHLYQFTSSQTGYVQTFSNSSVYPLSSLNGSPVGYEQVTVFHGDTIQNTGKSIYNYAITPDSLLVWSQPQLDTQTPVWDSAGIRHYWQSSTAVGDVLGIRPVPRLWENGEPLSELDYLYSGKGQYILQRSKNTTYKNFYIDGGTATYISYGIEFNGFPRQTFGMYGNPNIYKFYDYPIIAGVRMPVQTIISNFDKTGNALTKDTIRYYYDNSSHMFTTRTVSYDGRSDSLVNQIKYPQDMIKAGLDPGGIYAAMTTANIISPVVQFTEFKNNQQLQQSITNYGVTNGIYNPQTISLQVLSNPAETRLNYQYYNNGNIQSTHKPSGPLTSYQWGYNSEYPVAQAINASSNDIFYDSFEEGDGNSASGDAKTGNYSHTGTYTKNLSGLDAGSYVLSYWQETSGVWSLQSSTINVSGSTYTISLSTQVDDVRFYPAGAQMVTYTYAPLVGVTSSTDAKDETTYYEYDALQRLVNIKDKDRNVTKHYTYHYQGQ